VEVLRRRRRCSCSGSGCWRSRRRLTPSSNGSNWRSTGSRHCPQVMV
jgi:hypothetical protein